MKRLAPFLSAIVLSLPATVLANPNIGSLRGVVSGDAPASPALFRGVEVTLESNLGEFRARADASGSFIIFGIPPGRYALRAARPGFSPWGSIVCIRAGQDQAVHLRLHQYHIDFSSSVIYGIAPANDLQLQPSQPSDVYTLGACD